MNILLKFVYVFCIIMATAPVYFATIKTIENFLHVEHIDYCVISLKPPDRLQNISAQQTEIHKSTGLINLEIVDAVAGKELDLDSLQSEGIVKSGSEGNFSKSIKNEIGCYLSHLKIYNMIAGKNKPGYSVIFEDDISLLDGFVDKLETLIEKMKDTNFDFLFLSILNGRGGEQVYENVYNLPKGGEQYGTWGYMVKNESINKIIENLTPIEYLIDGAIFKKGKSGDLIVYVVEPEIVSPGNFGTTIRTVA